MAMSDEHRAALRRGRAEAAAIKRYLDALSARKPGRPVTAESLEKRIKGVQEQIDGEDSPLKRIELVQKRLDLEKQLAAVADAPDLEALEAEFIKYAKGYSERKGITYSAWREGGVPASVLKKAGISRSSK